MKNLKVYTIYSKDRSEEKLEIFNVALVKGADEDSTPSKEFTESLRKYSIFTINHFNELIKYAKSIGAKTIVELEKDSEKEKLVIDFLKKQVFDTSVAFKKQELAEIITLMSFVNFNIKSQRGTLIANDADVITIQYAKLAYAKHLYAKRFENDTIYHDVINMWKLQFDGNWPEYAPAEDDCVVSNGEFLTNRLVELAGSRSGVKTALMTSNYTIDPEDVDLSDCLVAEAESKETKYVPGELLTNVENYSELLELIQSSFLGSFENLQITCSEKVKKYNEEIIEQLDTFLQIKNN